MGLAVVVLGGTAHGGVIFSNFGPNDSFVGFPGQPVLGADVGPGPLTLAVSFDTGPTGYTLTSVELPILPDNVNSREPLLLDVRADAGGLPGDDILTTKSLVIVPFPGVFIQTWLVGPGIELAPNSRYWVVAMAGAPTAHFHWFFNNQAQAGLATNRGQGWRFEGPPATPVMRVSGAPTAVPEPSSATLLLAPGLLGLARLMARRRRPIRP